MSRISRLSVSTALAVTAALAAACAAPRLPMPAAQAVESPAKPGSLLPQVTGLSGGRLAASWLEPLEKGYRFVMAVREADAWSDARTIASGPDVVMFTADLPGVVEMPDGQLLAYWQKADRSGPDPYATAIQLARSADAGRSWTAPISPHRDGVIGSHSFVAPFVEESGVGLVWLGGQKQRFMPAAP